MCGPAPGRIQVPEPQLCYGFESIPYVAPSPLGFPLPFGVRVRAYVCATLPHALSKTYIDMDLPSL